MAWSLLQSASHQAAAATNPVTMGSNCSSTGSTLIAYVAQTGATAGTVSSVKDGAGNSFLFCASAVIAGNAGTYGLSVWAINTPAVDQGAKPVITATMSTGTPDSEILVQEVSGLAVGSTLAALVDGTPGVINAGTGTGATGSPVYVSHALNEYLVGVYGDDGDSYTFTKPAALALDANSLNSSALDDLGVAYGNSTNGTEAGSWTLTVGSGGHWGVLLLAFNLAAGGAAAPAAVQPAQPGLTWRRHFRHPQQLVQAAPSGPQTIIGSASVAGAGAVFAGSFTPSQQPPAAAMVYVTRKPPGRAVTGTGGPSGGIASRRLAYGYATAAGAGAVTAFPAAAVPRRPQTAALVYVARKPPGRALAGKSPVGGGITGPQPPAAGIGAATAAGAGAVTAVVTQAVIAAAAGAGIVTAAAVQTVTATAAGAGAVTAVATQGVTASAAGAGSAFAVPVGFLGGAPSPGMPVVIGRPNLARARVGRGTAGGGIAVTVPAVTVAGTAAIAGAGAVSANAVIPAQRPQVAAPVYVARKPAGRARVGKSPVGGGITGPQPPAAGIGAATAAGAGAVTAVVTQAVIAAAAGAGIVTAAAVQTVTATAAGAGAVTAIGGAPGSGTASVAGAGAVTAVTTQAVAATGAGAGSVTVAATQAAKATAAGTGAVSASGVIPGTASVAGAGAATAAAGQSVTATAAGAGVLAALAAQQAIAALTGAGTVTAAGNLQLAFTVGVLTSATAPGAATGGVLTASDQRTGGPS